MRNFLSRWIHGPLAQRWTPEKAKTLYRVVRDRTQRLFYDPRRFWTRFGRTYRQRFPPRRERCESLIVGLLREAGVASALDVGCGYGRYLRAIREALPQARLCGVDISPTQIAEARDYLRNAPDIELKVASATALPLPDRSFEALLTYGLMIHLRMDEVAAFLEEAKRVCGKWGLFLESCANPDRPYLNPPYYFAHPYEEIFPRHGIALVRRIPVDESVREYLYLTRLGN